MKKLYFENEDSNVCMPLGDCLDNTDKLKEVTLMEAVPYRGSEYCWCTHEMEVVEREDCKKSVCDWYTPNKSGRGTCSQRGKMYKFGEKVTFNVKSGKLLNKQI